MTHYRIFTTSGTFYVSESDYPTVGDLYHAIHALESITAMAHGVRGGIDDRPLSVVFNPAHVVAVIEEAR